MSIKRMQWKEFRDDLGGLKVEGLGYHAPTELITINQLPTDIYVITKDYNNRPWIAAMGFVWSSEDKYKQGIFTGIVHNTFTPLTQLINGYKNMFTEIRGSGKKFEVDEAHALIMAAYDFSKFHPKYEKCLNKSIKSIIAQVQPIDSEVRA